jgi:hypothetical protein
LAALPAPETRNYIEHRLQVAGLSGEQIFTADACATIAELSFGIPRNINNLCFNALSLGFALRQKTIDADLMREVAADFDLTKLLSQAGSNDPAADFGEDSAPRSNDWPDLQTLTKRASQSRPAAAANNARNNEALTLVEAKAYMQRIIQLLRDGSPIPNQASEGVARIRN